MRTRHWGGWGRGARSIAPLAPVPKLDRACKNCVWTFAQMVSPRQGDIGCCHPSREVGEIWLQSDFATDLLPSRERRPVVRTEIANWIVSSKRPLCIERV